MKKVIAAILILGLLPVVIGAPKTDLRGRTKGATTLYVDCPHDKDTASNGDTIFTDTGGVKFTGGDYTPAEPMHGLLVSRGAGNVSVVMEGGGVIVTRVVVDSTTALKEVFGHCSIVTIDSAKTTFTGHIFPLF
jgi:hypothetical protein